MGTWYRPSAGDPGFDDAGLRALSEALKEGRWGNIHAVLIARNGSLVFEEYLSGEDESIGESSRFRVVTQDSLHDIRSISKTVTGTLLGIAVAEGLVASLDVPLRELFPEYSGLLRGPKEDLRLRHALTMSTGLQWDEESLSYTDPANDERQLSLSDDPIAFYLARDLVHAPGDVFEYSAGATNLLAEVVKRSSGETLEAFARRLLFTPLGITQWEWRATGNVQHSPYAGLRLTVRDMAKIGQLYLDRGVYNGSRVLPEHWAQAATQRHVAVPADDTAPTFVLEDGYGYQWWWSRFQFPSGPHDVATAIGNGEQRIIVIPHLSLVVAILAGFYDEADHWWTPERLLMEEIIPALAN